MNNSRSKFIKSARILAGAFSVTVFMKKRVGILLFLNVLVTALLYAETPQTWKNIKVSVNADQPVETTQSLKEDANGFQRLAITLSNKGKL